MLYEPPRTTQVASIMQYLLVCHRELLHPQNVSGRSPGLCAGSKSFRYSISLVFVRSMSAKKAEPRPLPGMRGHTFSSFFLCTVVVKLARSYLQSVHSYFFCISPKLEAGAATVRPRHSPL